MCIKLQPEINLKVKHDIFPVFVSRPHWWEEQEPWGLTVISIYIADLCSTTAKSLSHLQTEVLA